MEWFSGHELRIDARLGCNRAETERVHHRQRPRTHGENIAQNAADPGRSALKWLDVTGMVVALNLERASPAVPNINDSSILARALHDAIALGRQAAQVNAAGFVGAMLAPHHAVNPQFRKRGDPPQRCQNSVILVLGNAVLGQQLRGYRHRIGNNCRGCGGHHDCLHCRTGARSRRTQRDPPVPAAVTLGNNRRAPLDPQQEPLFSPVPGIAAFSLLCSSSN